MKLAEKTDVIKASPAIQIQSKITHLQRKAWNVLLANAYDELPTQDIHAVSIAELAEKLDFNSKNDEYLKETLEALVDCKLKWNLLNKDRKEKWGVASLLASTEIEGGVCTYGFAPHLRPKLHNPRIYAKINLRLQNKFKSKHGLILWELCIDYFDESRNEGETPFIPLETFKELMGIDHDEYKQFKELNKFVIKPSIKEINEVSGFLVEVEYKKQSRRVVAVKFRIQKLKQVPANDIKQRDLFPDDTDMEGIALELYQAGMSRGVALKVLNQGWEYVDADKRPEGVEFDDYVREKIHLLKTTESVKNKGAFLRTAIKENYTNEKFQQAQRGKAYAQINQEIQDFQAQKEEIEGQRDDKVDTICRQILEENPDTLDKALEAAFEETPELKHGAFYNHDKTPMQNYARPFIAVPVNQQLRKLYPDRFNEIDAYNKRIKEFEKAVKEGKAKIEKMNRAAR